MKQHVQDSVERERDDITDLTTNPATKDAEGIIASVGKGVGFNGNLEMVRAAHALPREILVREVGVIAQPELKRANG